MARKVGSVYAEIRADIKKLQGDFDKAHGETQRAARKIQDTLDKGINFEKVAAGAVAAGAAIYSMFRTLSQVMESARIGSVLDKQAKSFVNLTDAAGTSSKKMLESLKLASQGLVAESDLIGAAGKALLMNIPANEIVKLMEIAAATSKTTGQSITEAFNDITMGVARQSRMILDNLGIIVNADKANQDYAKALGKTASSLNDAEKRQAFMNAVLKSGADMVERIGGQSGALDGVNKLISAQADLWNEVNKTVATFLDEELSSYAKALKGIAEILKGMRSGAGEITKSDAWKEIEMLKSLESKGMAQPGTAAAKEAAWNAKYLKPQFGLKPSEELKRSGSFTTAPWDGASWKEREGQWVDYTDKEKEAMIKANEEAKKQAEKDFLELQRHFENLSTASWAYTWENDSLNKIRSQVDRYGGFMDAVREKEKAVQEESWRVQADNENTRLMESVKRYEETHKKLTNLTERTAEAMQQNFSNLFFDFMTGKLKSFEDYAKAVFESIARAAADLMSQQLTRGLFGQNMQGGGWLSQLFGGGSMSVGGVGGTMTGSQIGASQLPVNTLPYQPFHSGGVVGASGGGMRAIPAAYYHSAPRYHSGLMPDEQPAILQKGETVLPKGTQAGGGDTYNFYNISAMDSESMVQALRRSGAVPLLAVESINNNSALRKTIMSRAR